MTARSYLFVPGDRADMLAKATGRGADALIADLEDAVAPLKKEAARATVGEWLDGLVDPPCPIWVRVNAAGEWQMADLAVAAAPALSGLMVPKVRAAAELADVAAHLDEIEASAGLAAGRTRLLPIIETALAMQNVAAIAAAPRVEQLMIGELDLGAELGVDPTFTEALLPLRVQVVLASAAAGIAPPLGPVSPDYRDLVALEADTAALVRQGFGGRPAIHPAQVHVINAVFTPTDEELAKAQRLVAMYEAALAEGRGAATDEDGHMVDEAVVRVARRVIAAAGRGEAAAR